MRITVLAPLLLAACASASTTVADERPSNLPPSVTRTSSGAEVRISNNDRGVIDDIPVNPAVVWDALLGVYDDFDLEPDNLDPNRRRIGISRLTKSTIAGEKSSDLARCGNQGAGPSAASRFRVTFVIQSAVVPNGRGATLQTLVQASATPVDGTSVSRVACVSTGALEKRLHEGVFTKLGIRR